VRRPPHAKDPGAALPPARGLLNVYASVRLPGDGPLHLDLGFEDRLPLAVFGLSGLLPDLRYHVTGAFGRGFSAEPLTDRRAAFYTYLARVHRVVDGDTCHLRIDKGFGIEQGWTVRLRGIDAPELDTPAGALARKFVDDRLSGHSVIGVTTFRPDKYGRYLADLFIPPPDASSPQDIIDRGEYLNRALIDAGHARRV
jgi:endonuclease YncB( thermonuclease family)